MPAPAAREPVARTPTVDDVEFRALYKKTKYVVETADGWSLVITRYRPVPQSFPQPLFGEPMLLVHGFCQNRHAWTSGEFVKNLLFFGLDIHILELRGHGKSSIELQHERAARFGRKAPADLDWDWDIDSYFLYDLPAAVAGVRRITRRDRIFYCGHSMGGMLGYGYAGIHQEHFEGIITIITAGIDAALGGINLQRGVGQAVSQAVSKLTRWDTKSEAKKVAYRYLPLDTWLKAASDALGYAEQSPVLSLIANRFTYLTRWDKMSMSDVRWLLKEGGEKEPRKVVDQFLRWIRGQEVVCYRTAYDFQRGFSKIRVPMAIIFGDMDPLASLASTRSVYRAAKSEYLLWRPVKGNSHIELTMGHDIRQICYDIKNLIEYAKTHRARSPSLPRLQD
jgi:pimeloyl-ACP methyl ester carboxylesterase